MTQIRVDNLKPLQCFSSGGTNYVVVTLLSWLCPTDKNLASAVWVLNLSEGHIGRFEANDMVDPPIERQK